MTRLVALASRAVLRGFGVGSTVSQADDASLAPRESGTATLKTGGSAGRSHRGQKNGKEGTWKQTAEQAGYWMGLVAVALFILIGYAYHTKLSEEERKDKCAPCRAALLTVTNRDSATMDEAEQALGLKASKD